MIANGTAAWWVMSTLKSPKTAGFAMMECSRIGHRAAASLRVAQLGRQGAQKSPIACRQSVTVMPAASSLPGAEYATRAIWEIWPRWTVARQRAWRMKKTRSLRANTTIPVGWQISATFVGRVSRWMLTGMAARVIRTILIAGHWTRKACASIALMRTIGMNTSVS